MYVGILEASRDGHSYQVIHGYSDRGELYASWDHPGMAVVTKESTDTLMGVMGWEVHTCICLLGSSRDGDKHLGLY